uniref:Putative secreted protein n=1 Tax=Anopheles triannulatus TaxID=58253 RepID=A0A2M4B1I8_9DIPT
MLFYGNALISFVCVCFGKLFAQSAGDNRNPPCGVSCSITPSDCRGQLIGVSGSCCSPKIRLPRDHWQCVALPCFNVVFY